MLKCLQSAFKSHYKFHRISQEEESISSAEQQACLHCRTLLFVRKVHFLALVCHPQMTPAQASVNPPSLASQSLSHYALLEPPCSQANYYIFQEILQT